MSSARGAPRCRPVPDIRYRVASAADGPAVRRCMAEIFQETAGQKTGEFGEALWQWQYTDAPGGSIVVLAEEGELVCGYYHVLLFPMRVSGRACTAAMVQDVGTRREYRKHGIFKLMGAYALDRMRDAGVSFIYTFPNPLSLPSFVRNHQYTVVARAPVRVLPLQSGPLLAGRLPGWVGRGLGLLTDPLCGLPARLRAPAAGERIVREDRIPPVIDTWTGDASQPTAVSLTRSAGYLAWRFFAKPTVSYTMWSLRREDAPLAYLVTRRARMFGVDCVLLMDFGYQPGQRDALLRLVAGRLAGERAEGAAMAVTMGLHPVFRQLTKLGFLRVPERFNPRTFNLLVKDLEPDPRPELFRGSDWTITLADWDVF